MILAAPSPSLIMACRRRADDRQSGSGRGPAGPVRPSRVIHGRRQAGRAGNHFELGRACGRACGWAACHTSLCSGRRKGLQITLPPRPAPPQIQAARATQAVNSPTHTGGIKRPFPFMELTDARGCADRTGRAGRGGMRCPASCPRTTLTAPAWTGHTSPAACWAYPRELRFV